MTPSNDKHSHEEETGDESEDPVEQAIGSMGLWQMVICCSVSLVKVAVAWHQLSILFLAPPQEFWCSKPNEWTNISSNVWKNISSPHEEWGKACKKFNTSLENMVSGNTVGVELIPCTSWEYDTSTFLSTIIQEWNLVCDRAILVQVAQMVYMFGIFVGSFIFGLVSDWYGRRDPLILAVVLQVCAGVGTAFSTNFIVFSIMRFLDAVATGGTMVNSIVIVMEVVGRKWRALTSILYQIPFSLGHISLAGVSYVLRDWRQYQLALSIPSAILITYYWLVPESPRWLLASGKTDKALAIMRSAAKRNNLPESQVEAVVKKYVHTEKSSSIKASFFDLFKHPNLRMYTLCMAFQWLVCGIGFYGLAQYMGQIAGNIFVNVSIGGLLDLPGAFIVMYTTERFGRKKTLTYSMLLAGVSCISLIFVPSGEGAPVWPAIVLSSLGVTGICMAFPTVYLYSGEIFPTVLRNIGVGFVIMSARIGSMAAPFVSGLSSVGAFVPPLVFGLLPLMAFLLSFLLPETVNRKLPDTIEDVENLSRDQRIKKPTYEE